MNIKQLLTVGKTDINPVQELFAIATFSDVNK